MSQFANDWEFEHITSAPYHQQANGKSEAAVEIAKRLLLKADESGNDFWYALLHWRNIPNKIESSPASRLFSRSTRCGVPMSATNLLPKIVENVPANIERNRKKSKFQYDKKTKNLPELAIGSPVYVQLNPDTSKLWSAGRVSDQLSDRSYRVNVNGSSYRRSLVHIKPRKEPSSESGSMQIKPTELSPEKPPKENTTYLRTNDRQKETANQNINKPESVPALMFSPEQDLPVTPQNVTPSSSRKSSAPSEEVSVRSRPKREIRLPKKLKDYLM